MAPTRGRRPVEEPGHEADEDLAERLGLDDPALQHDFTSDLERVRDAELRGEFDTEGIRLR